MSTLDPVKLSMFGDAVGDALHQKKKTETYSIAEIHNKVKEVINNIEDEDLRNKLEVVSDPRGVTLKIPSEISFASGSAELNTNIYSILQEIEPIIGNSRFPIAVEGHTDNVPIRSPIFPSNWELSASRASQVVKYFIKIGVDPQRLQAIGYADTRPLMPNLDEQGDPISVNQSKNRRVEIIFLTLG